MGKPTIYEVNGGQYQRTYSPISNRFLWHGRAYGFKTKLYYFRNRWYDPGPASVHAGNKGLFGEACRLVSR